MDQIAVCLEVDYIDLIEPDQGHEESDICLCDAVTSQIPGFAENLLHSVQGRKECPSSQDSIELALTLTSHLKSLRCSGT